MKIMPNFKKKKKKKKDIFTNNLPKRNAKKMERKLWLLKIFVVRVEKYMEGIHTLEKVDPTFIELQSRQL